MQKRALSPIALCVALLMAPQLQAAAKHSVAIHPLQTLGTEQQIVDRLEELLRAEVDRLKQVSLQKRDATVAAVQATADAVNCSTEACLAAIGRTAKVDQLVFGTVATLGESYVLDLKLIDVKSQKQLRRESSSLSGEKAVLIEGIRSLATQLVAPELFVGSLELRLEKPGAEVYIDGSVVGTTPLKTIAGLTPGKHALKIVLTGYKDFDRFIEVRHARTTIVNVALSGDTIDATIEAKQVEPGDVGDAPVLVVTEVPGASEPKPEPSVWDSPLFLNGVIFGGAGAALALIGISSVIFEATVFQGFLGAQYATPCGESRDGENLNVNCIEKAEDASKYHSDYNDNKDTAGMLWIGGWTVFGIGVASLLTGGGLLAWSMMDGGSEAAEAAPAPAPDTAAADETGAETAADEGLEVSPAEVSTE